MRIPLICAAASLSIWFSACSPKCKGGELKSGDKCVRVADAGRADEDGTVTEVGDDAQAEGNQGGEPTDEMGSTDELLDGGVSRALDDSGAAQSSPSGETGIAANPCASDNGSCDLNATCDPGGEPRCRCRLGFYMDGALCRRGVISVAPGPQAHAIKSDGTLWRWGLLDGPVPAPFGSIGGWTQVAGELHGYGTGLVSHGCGIRGAGELYCWGTNHSGQLGIGSRVDAPLPTRVGSDGDWQAVSAGGVLGGYSCGIRAGSLFCWGSNAAGMLGPIASSRSDEVLVPKQVGTRSDWSAISTGAFGACGIAGGALLCWVADRQVAQVSSQMGWESVSVGADFACALKGGQLHCWGDDGLGAVGDGAGTGSAGLLAEPIRIGSESDWKAISCGLTASCGIRDGGKLHCWGAAMESIESDAVAATVPTLIDARPGWELVAVGLRTACATREGGRLECWGTNASGALANSDVNRDAICAPRRIGLDSDWAAVSAGWGYTCGVKGRDLYCWGQVPIEDSRGSRHGGYDYAPKRLTPEGDWQTVSLHAGGNHACGLRAGQIYCWGESADGQLGTGEVDLSLDPIAPVRLGEQTWTALSVGVKSTCARSGGNVSCWGLFNDPQGTRRDVTPQAIPNSDWLRITVGSQARCGVRASGLWCWGFNYGTSAASPVQLATTTLGDRSLSLGAHSCATGSAGLFCWGSNDYGELGLGSAAVGVNQSAPQQVRPPSGWDTAAVGNGISCALKTYGELFCWGRKFSGCGESHDVEPVQMEGRDWWALTVGADHACAIKQDRSLWCWGNHSAGAVGIGPYWSATPVAVQWPDGP